MKNEVKISRLMDAYTDGEFFIQGESEVDLDTVKNNVIAKAAGKNKRVKPLVKVLIAAAAAAVLAAGATAARIVTRGGYDTPTGISVNYWWSEDGGGWGVSFDEDRPVPIKVEEGKRLMFAANGQNIDITNLVDENTPYIYTYKNSAGDACYIVAGGAAGDYGYIDLVPVMVAENVVRWEEFGWNTHLAEPSEQETDPIRRWFKPWCLAAFDELDIWGHINGFGEHVAPQYITEFNESIGYVYSDE